MKLKQVFAPRLPGVGPYMAGRFALDSLFMHYLSFVPLPELTRCFVSFLLKKFAEIEH
jgi:hypothetical protein